MAQKIYSVRQINTYVRNMFEQDFLLAKVSVQGEVSNYKDHPTGHIYFTLKDKDAQLSVVMFAGNRRGLKCKLREGMEIIVTGQVNVYEAGGKYQLYAKEITEAGIGDLYQKYLELKNRLQEMGMFDPAFKKPLPRYARTVGIVTASSGAALHDIMQISERRNPYVQLVLASAQVQGDGAPESIISAIERLDAIHLDVMIVGRGGGSIEDLWAFNDEGVARAIFDADTPIISAVGHETDFTIADFVADHRAPTPSAAAELAVFDYIQYQNGLRNSYERMERILRTKTELLKAELDKKALALRLLHPRMKLLENTQRLSKLSDTMYRLMEERLSEKKQRLSILAERLQGRSPLDKLKGGYGFVEVEGKALLSAKQVKSGDSLQVTLKDGTVKGHVD